MSVSQNTDRPACFGTMWDPKSAECRGGPDPGYVHPRTGNNVREACSFFGACGTKTQAERMASTRTQQQQLVPPQALVRPEPPRAQPPTLGPTYGQQIQPTRGIPVPAQQMAPGHVQVPVQYDHFHPAQYQPLPVNYAIPGYLTVPEVREDNEGILAFAARSIARSMLKGGAHGLAHLIDTTPLRRKPKTENGG